MMEGGVHTGRTGWPYFVSEDDSHQLVTIVLVACGLFVAIAVAVVSFAWQRRLRDIERTESAAVVIEENYYEAVDTGVTAAKHGRDGPFKTDVTASLNDLAAGGPTGPGGDERERHKSSDTEWYLQPTASVDAKAPQPANDSDIPSNFVWL